MDELRVPKRRTPIEILLPGGDTHRVAVFLSDFASHHAGPERLSDLLNGEAEFLPIHDLAVNNVVLVNRHGLVLARVEAALETEVGEQATIPAEHEVEVTLSTGQVIKGLVTYVLPDERARLIDYLNQKLPFLRLVERDQVTFVNKRYVLQVCAVRR